MEIRNATVEQMDGTRTTYSFIQETAHGLRCYTGIGLGDLPKGSGYRIVPWFNVCGVDVPPKLSTVPDGSAPDVDIDVELQMRVPE